MMRIVLAVLMALHGIAHLVGFAGSWRLARSIPYRSTILAGRLDLGDAGIRVVGVLWLLAAIAFWISAAGAATSRPWWVPVAVATSLGSLLLSVVAWPDSRIGVALNLLILGALLAGRRQGWW